MNLYIAYNVYNEPISMLLANNKMDAERAWLGLGSSVYAIKELDIELNKSGVVFLLLSKDLEAKDHRYIINGEMLKEEV